MPKTFTRAKDGDEAMQLIRETIRDHYPDLAECDAKIAVIYVDPARDKDGNVTGPALKFAGVGAAAKTKIESPENRAMYKTDARILIDKVVWDDLHADGQAALIDHELCHIVVARNKGGMIETHDDLRPKLRTRPDDWLINGFREVVERHGAAAIDYQNVQSIVTAKDSKGNLLFDFAAPKRTKGAA